MPPDFSGQNLRGRSFKGRKDLTGANFSYADIRGTDFTGANLIGANFSHVQAGLRKRWVNFLVLISWLLAGLSGFFSAFAGSLMAVLLFYLNANYQEQIAYQIAGWTAIVIVVIFFFITIRQGIQAGLGAFAFAVAFALASVFAFAVVVTGVLAGTVAVLVAVILAGTIAGAITGAIAGAIAGAITGAIALAIAIAVAVAIAIAGAGTVAFAIPGTGTVAFPGAIAFAIVETVAVTLLSIYIGWRSLKGDEKHAVIRNIAVAFAATGGTSFRNANLTDANFTGATLKSTDFRKANLTRTCFYKTKKLDLARFGVTYLQKAQVRSVLVTGQGQDKIFDRQDLRGINLRGAHLVDASFIAANLSSANLQDADLSRAKLVQTQLDSTDFTGATLTGAYIEDWGITSDTNFDGVRCEYVYMRLPTKENPDPLRKPDNREEVFADGEFGDFIKPIVDTLDLYHNSGVDPRAIAISFKQLAENHPDADLRIVGMEVRGEDKFLLRAKTAPDADKSELSAEYFEIYNQLKALAEKELQKLIAEKDSRIRSLETMVTTALQSPKFYSNTQVEKVDNMNPSQGGINQSVSNSQLGQGLQAVQGSGNQLSMNNNENYKTKYDQSHAQIGGFVDTAQSGSQQTFHQNISAPEQKQTLAEAAAEIQQLLEQLSQSYPTNTMSGKMALAAEATQRIENNPTLIKKVVSSLKAGGTAALEQLLSHPAASFVIAALDDWYKNNQ